MRFIYTKFDAKRWTFIGPFLLLLCVWSFYLLGYWPGMMTYDSYDQWGQMLRWQFDDWHPVPHTLYIWLLTRIALTPGVVALFQLLITAFVLSCGIAYFRKLGLPLLVYFALIGFFALSPVFPGMSLALWKDVPYSVAILGFSLLSLKMAIEEPKGLNWKVGLGLALCGLAISLFRRNGFLVVFPSLFFVWLLANRGYRRLIVIVSACVIAGSLLTNLFVNNVLRAKQSGDEMLKATVIHQIAGMLKNGTTLDDVTAKDYQLESFQENWTKNYICYSMQGPYSAEDFYLPERLHTLPDLANLWFRLFISAPSAWWKHQVCAGQIVWRAQIDQNQFPLYTLPYLDPIFPNSYEIYPQPISIRILDLIRKWFIITNWDGVIRWVWFPAVYLYLTVFFVAINIFVHRSLDALSIALPSIFNSIAIFFLAQAQDMRFQYCVFLVAPFCAAAGFVLIRKKDTAA